MSKLFLAFWLITIAGTVAFAQNTDYKKTEFYIGYSNNLFDRGADTGTSIQRFFGDRTAFQGFEGAAVYNVRRYIGIKADFSGAYYTQKLTSAPATTPITNINLSKNSIYNFLGGVQFKDNASKSRFKPFAHIMIGAGYRRTKFDGDCQGFCTGAAAFSQTGLAGAFGGGLDVKLSNRIDLRVIQIDYNPIRLNDRVSHDVRFGAGINFK